ncbi:anti-sigma factor family protein [Martelella endophytica]|uniref:Anti-sigma factor n=1 Tax=Martelella endophytica TaxID=1486262 RepID=A0A0D5LSX6_MAREN|nr:hypothetical protein [Martelella endophytica]AJY47070.1 hypothetical protein TM49_17570 [Martelella endophytica]
MNDRSDDIREFDLLALADGLLDDDPTRKAEVEAFLRANPAAKAFVEEIREQNALLRLCCRDRQAGPVPERLRDTVWKRRPRTGAPVLKAAVFAFTLLAAGVVGSRYDEFAAGRASISNSLIEAVSSGAAAPAGMLSLAAGKVDAHDKWLWLAFPTPDLSAEGYELISREDTTTGAPGIVRLVYRNAGGETLDVFMQPSGTMEKSRPETRSDGARTARYMTVGPMEVGVTAESGNLDAKGVMKTLEDSIGDMHFAKPASTISASAETTPVSDLVAPTLEN